MGIALAAVWGICLHRAILFGIDSRAVYAQAGSIDAWNDYVYAVQIVVSYAVCAGTGFGAWWRAGRRSVFRVPVWTSMLSGLCMVLLKPEAVIVFIPSLAPFYAAAGCLGVFLLSALPFAERRFAS